MAQRRAQDSAARRPLALLAASVSMLAGLVVVATAGLAGHPAPSDSTVLALLLAVTLAAVAVTRRTTAAAVRVLARPAGRERRPAATPAYAARQCDPDAAGRPRPRAPGRRPADLPSP
jgi:Family of unknown function (DUF6412)